MVRIGVLLGLLLLAGCADAFNQPASIPGGRPLWQNAPSNATFEPPGSRPR
jgi:hypothetical protein